MGLRRLYKNITGRSLRAGKIIAAEGDDTADIQDPAPADLLPESEAPAPPDMPAETSPHGINPPLSAREMRVLARLTAKQADTEGSRT